MLRYSLGSLCTRNFLTEPRLPQFGEIGAEEHRQLLCSQVCVGVVGTIMYVLELQLE